MPSEKPARFLALLFALVLGLTACEGEGPAEEAGEDVDEATEEATE
ncbi:hypothetical protein [Thiohalorhabdus denitrificans]|uniref:Uncharacterized protein n=1 Tax=Thiohalorhabdus denitrificans TaxID=381306 RepID=A0A1G5F8Y0_9GAMM|nr:hypothetical protein [Thiohalorhabdus denitrificans]SCY35716.1 hypothetical protein SAMN05661077_1861 [Thiohalorhabdus denitrificans]